MCLVCFLCLKDTKKILKALKKTPMASPHCREIIRLIMIRVVSKFKNKAQLFLLGFYKVFIGFYEAYSWIFWIINSRPMGCWCCTSELALSPIPSFRGHPSIPLKKSSEITLSDFPLLWCRDNCFGTAQWPHMMCLLLPRPQKFQFFWGNSSLTPGSCIFPLSKSLVFAQLTSPKEPFKTGSKQCFVCASARNWILRQNLEILEKPGNAEEWEWSKPRIN